MTSNPGNPFAGIYTPTYMQGYTSVMPPFSADATPTSSWFSSGLFGSGVGLTGSPNYLPPPDITGYTYGDYATPNYGNPAAAPVPQPSQAYNALNPVGDTGTTHTSYALVVGAVVGLILMGYLIDKHGHRQPRKKK